MRISDWSSDVCSSDLGTAVPLAEELTGSIRLSIKQMKLPSISPVAHRYLGLTLRTGRLDGDLNISADSGALDGKGPVGIARLQVDIRTEERRVGQEWFSPCRTRG